MPGELIGRGTVRGTVRGLSGELPGTSHRSIRATQWHAVVVSAARYNTARPDLILMAITSQMPAPTPFGEVIVHTGRRLNSGSGRAGGSARQDTR